jgi:hypothetical protein
MVVELVHKIVVHPGMKALEDGGQIIEEHSNRENLSKGIRWKYAIK